ncbi:MAG TPA: transposase [Syntrophorhabdaceae bacterium]|nr:transposase [Syntrophorhabdaceae bacterium]HQM81078.1 transposase [Syntrophorhabdaceae bacterium]
MIYHVIVRGIEKKSIFVNDRDRKDFFKRCSELLPETKISCYAWAFMPNHVHLLLRTGDVSLSTLMARLLTGYATSFNRRHKRAGHLFQNRYRSIICQEEVYLKELVRYIHLNPLRAGIVPDFESLARFSWCGHSVLFDNKTCTWLDKDYILSFFGTNASKAKTSYLEFVKAGINQGRNPELAGGSLIRSLGGWEEANKCRSHSLMKGDERILGDKSFVMGILAKAEEKMARRYAIRQSGLDIATIEKRISDICEINLKDLYCRGRHKRLVEARSIFCFWAVQELEVTMKDLALRFAITEAAVSYAVRRGQNIVQKKGLKLF